MYRDNPLKKISWQDFQGLSPEEKGPYFLRDRRPYHVLTAQQFDRPTLEGICDLTTKIRMIGKTKGGIHFLIFIMNPVLHALKRCQKRNMGRQCPRRRAVRV